MVFVIIALAASVVDYNKEAAPTGTGHGPNSRLPLSGVGPDYSSKWAIGCVAPLCVAIRDILVPKLGILKPRANLT